MKRLAALAAGGADEHDMSGGGTGARLRLHLSHRMLDQAEDGVKVDGKSIAPLLVAHLLDGDVFGRPDAVIGHENVEASKMLHDFGHQRAGRVWIIKLGGEGMTVFAAFFGETFGLRLRLLIAERELR